MRNDVNALIKELQQQLREKDTIIERLKWRNRNQRNEIKKLNRAHIVKNNHHEGRVSSLEYMVRSLRNQLNPPKQEGGCCGGKCHE